MSDVINAVTKNRQSDDTIKAMADRAFGRSVNEISIKELAGGLCNAVYLVECDKEKSVLKIASSKDVVTMRHEKDYVKVEAQMLKIFADKIDIAAPELIYFDDSGEVCSEPYFFMSFVSGSPLLSLKKRPDDEQLGKIKFELGKICGQISSLKSDYFGIPMLKDTFTKSNCDFMLTMIKMLLQDIADKNQTIPYITPENLLVLIEKNRCALDEVKQAVYVHTDTWDGNIMVEDNRLSALVDYAAILFGDPLLTHDFHDFSPEVCREFADGFGKTVFSENEKTRIIVYKIWQRLGMIAECAFRGYDNPNQYSWVWGEFTNAVKELEGKTK